MQATNYEEAAEQFEKVLLYNPGSSQANNYLSEIYNIYLPDTEKYLRYALRGVQLEANIYDSTAATFSYLHLANALMQTGFVEEAEEHILKSLSYDSNNLFSQYLYAYILMAKDDNVERSRDMVIETFKQDTTRLDVLQNIGKLSYVMGDYKSAYLYYDHFARLRKDLDYGIFMAEDLLIGHSYEMNGFDSMANVYYDSYKEFADNDSSKYQGLLRASYHALLGDADDAIRELRAFSQEDHIQYWFVKYFESDPIILRISNHPEYREIADKITRNFWKEHEELKLRLQEARLLNWR